MSKYTFILFLFLIAACKPSMKEITGVYYSKHSKGNEFIELRSNHTFLESYKNDTVHQQNTGKWYLEMENGISKITLQNYKWYTSPFTNDASIGKKGTIQGTWEDNVIKFYPKMTDYNYYKEPSYSRLKTIKN